MSMLGKMIKRDSLEIYKVSKFWQFFLSKTNVVSISRRYESYKIPMHTYICYNTFRVRYLS